VKIIEVIILTLTLTAFVAASLGAAPGSPQTVCPVLAGAIDKQVYVDYQGKRIYFCCKGCDETFKKDPDKYMKKLNEQGVVLEPSPEAPKKP
jgi:YHS domain-containing protein